MKKNNTNRILIDINILFNEFLHKNPNYRKNTNAKEVTNNLQCSNALDYIRRKRVFKTYISDYGVVKFISLMESIKVPKVHIVKEMDALLKNNSVISIGGKLISDTINEFRNNSNVNDIEDSFQFAIARKQDCDYILTLNTKDFVAFQNLITIVHPAKTKLFIS